MKNYIKYGWVGNRIKTEDMQRLYRLKQENKKAITLLVSEAVAEYLDTRGRA